MVYDEVAGTWSYVVRGAADSPVIALAGDIDLAALPQLREILTDGVRRVRRLEVSLANVTFIDSAGISILVAALNAADVAGCEFVITEPSPAAARVLYVAGLLESLTGHVEPADGNGGARQL